MEGTDVYSYATDSVIGIKEIKVVKSSGSHSLDEEGRRLLWQTPKNENESRISDISICFKLADNKIY